MSGKITFSQDIVEDVANLYSVVNYNVQYIKPEEYKLSVTGDVDSEKEYSLADIQAMEQVTRRATKMCGTNSAGGFEIYNVEYTGLDLISFLKAAGMKDGVNCVVATAWDGWGFPIKLSLLQEANAMIAFQYNGKDLEARLGYPAAMVVPGNGAFVWVKYLKNLQLQTLPEDQLPEPLPIVYTPNAGFLVPAADGQQLKSPVHFEGYAFAGFLQPVTKLLLSADYGEHWNEYPVPEGFDPAQWVNWKIDWDAPAPGTYLFKVKAQSGDSIQSKEHNVVFDVVE